MVSQRNPALAAKIAQLSLPLAPLVSLPTGHIHPSFPSTLLNFWLLTSIELDELAHFYHQRTPGPWTRHYPCPIQWKAIATLEEKRRKLGRFIGLIGCESPVVIQTEQEVMEEVTRERELAAEKESFMGKGKWY